MSDIDLSVAERVATITLSRPPVNALMLSMMGNLIEALEAADADDDVRAVILTGQGRCFSARVDLRDLLAQAI